MIKIILHGCNGKMGQVVAGTAAKYPDLQIVAGIDKFPDSRENPFPVYASMDECMEKADVIVDFSVPAAIPNLMRGAVKLGIPVIIATTGLSGEELSSIEEASKSIAVFRAANMSLGVNLMYELVHKAASVFGDQFDVEIIEKHHNQKIDSPSGTAYALADAINEAFLHSKDYTYGRHSKNQKRSVNEIGIHAVRGGTIVGEHEVLFAGNDETLQIIHTAYSKQIFAEGALRAVRFILGKSPGLYSMKDLMVEQSPVTNVYTNNEQAMISLSGLPDDLSAVAKIFRFIADEEINIDMISQTSPRDGRVTVNFTLQEKDLENAVKQIERLRAEFPDLQVEVLNDITKLSVEGAGMESQHGVAARVFDELAKQGIRIRAISTSETKISYIIDQRQEKSAVEAIIRAFGL